MRCVFLKLFNESVKICILITGEIYFNIVIGRCHILEVICKYELYEFTLHMYVFPLCIFAMKEIKFLSLVSEFLLFIV